MLQAVSAGFPVTIPELIEFLAIAFAAGGLAVAVKSHDKRLTHLETKRDEDLKAHQDDMKRIEERAVTAIETLGVSIQGLSTRLEVMVATHEQRLATLEKEEGR